MVVVNRRRCVGQRAMVDDDSVQPTARTSARFDQKLNGSCVLERQIQTLMVDDHPTLHAVKSHKRRNGKYMGREEALDALCMAFAYMGGGSGTEQKARSSPAGA